MSNAPVDVMEQMPAGGNQNAPESGTYGEQAELDRLKAMLPGEAPADQPAQAPLPPMSEQPPLTPPAPGLPKSLFSPTAQPGVPATAPLTPDDPPTSELSDHVIGVLELLAANADGSVSRTTQQWARTILEGQKQ